MAEKLQPLSWEAVVEAHDSRCVYCGRSVDHTDLTRDHVQPRCRKGSDSLQNLVPACFDCNNEKRDWGVATFVTHRRDSVGFVRRWVAALWNLGAKHYYVHRQVELALNILPDLLVPHEVAKELMAQLASIHPGEDPLKLSPEQEAARRKRLQKRAQKRAKDLKVRQEYEAAAKKRGWLV